MKVLVNAVSVKEGGSRVVLSRLLAAMHRMRPDIEWIVAAHPNCEATEIGAIGWFPAPYDSVLGIHSCYERWLPALIRDHRVDVLFSQTNYLPRRRLGCPSLLLIQHAGHFSAEFDRLRRQQARSPLTHAAWAMKRRWVHRSAQAATLLTVQTASLADRISASTGRARARITVIPHGPGLVAHRPVARGERQSGPLRVGYVAKWGVQKNFRTLFEAARLLRAGGATFRVVVTLDRKAAETRQVLEAAQELDVADLIDNAGELDANGVAALYDSLDVFVLPSLCESFGFPLVEAMARGLPLVVAATHENLEITAGAALSFAPFDPPALAGHLTRLLHDHAERGRWAELSLARGRAFSWERAAERTIGALESLL